MKTLIKHTVVLALLLAAPGLAAAQPITITVKGVSFKMVKVQGGTFTMGATPERDGDVLYNEKPAHRVTLSSYYIGETEVTQALWKAVMGSNPSEFAPQTSNASRCSYDSFVADAKRLNARRAGSVRIPTRAEWDAAMLTTTGSTKKPVEQVSWNDCQTFIQKLNQLTGRKFRLPTEAEWEFAARGGNSSRGYKYIGSNTLGDVAWYKDNSGGTTHDVKTKAPNELGIYDMTGNVFEWCQDRYGDYSSSAQTNPKGPTSGSDRVIRGSSWSSDARYCRTADRNFGTPASMGRDIGFRLAL